MRLCKDSCEDHHTGCRCGGVVVTGVSTSLPHRSFSHHYGNLLKHLSKRDEQEQTVGRPICLLAAQAPKKYTPQRSGTNCPNIAGLASYTIQEICPADRKNTTQPHCCHPDREENWTKTTCILTWHIHHHFFHWSRMTFASCNQLSR